MARHRHHDSLVWGLILIAVGCVFLLETLHVRVWHYVWRFWPAIFIFWGASKLYYGLKEKGQQEAAPAVPHQDEGHEN